MNQIKNIIISTNNKHNSEVFTGGSGATWCVFDIEFDFKGKIDRLDQPDKWVERRISIYWNGQGNKAIIAREANGLSIVEDHKFKLLDVLFDLKGEEIQEFVKKYISNMDVMIKAKRGIDIK